MKRILALILSAALLTGCSIGPLRLTPEIAVDSSSQPQEEQLPARQLTVYDPQGVLEEALTVYSEEQAVEVRQVDADEAALRLDVQMPSADTAKDLSGQGSLLPLAAEMRGTERCYGLPAGSGSYGYLVDNRMLKALLGEGFDQQILKDAGWKEWSEFVKTVDRWIEAPKGQTVTLGGKRYRLPKRKTEQTEALTGVFSIPAENAYCGSILTPILATQYKTAEQIETQKRISLTENTLKALGEVMLLETGSLTGVSGRLSPQQAPGLKAPAARQTFVMGKALFYRAPTGEAEFFDEALRNNLVLIPMKFAFSPEDLGENGFSMEEILCQPVTVAGSWLSISAAASPAQEKEAQAFLLWLYTSDSGKQAVPERTEPVQTGLPDLSAALFQQERQQLQSEAQQFAEQQP